MAERCLIKQAACKGGSRAAATKPPLKASQLLQRCDTKARQIDSFNGPSEFEWPQGMA
jgi:hypothetical protein